MAMFHKHFIVIITREDFIAAVDRTVRRQRQSTTNHRLRHARNQHNQSYTNTQS